jgi:hypothetical protein
VTEAVEAALIASLIGASAAIAGSFAAYWQGQKTLARELAHAERTRVVQARMEAYGKFLTSVDAFNLSASTALPLVSVDRIRPLLQEVMATYEIAILVAPIDTGRAIEEYYGSMVDHFDGTGDSSSERLDAARLALIVLARRDIGTEETVARPQGLTHIRS